MEAECYYKIGLIHEKMDDLGEAVLNVTKFLDKSEEDKRNQGLAHKKLAELNSKLGNAPAAIRNLEALLSIAFEDQNKEG
jgi:tetratricopeptide (TPR) repeat protein